MSPPVSIAHVITKLELGGAQQNTLFTVAHLDRSRFRPLLIAGRGGLLDAEAAALRDVPFHPIPALVRPIRPASDFRALLQLTALLRRLKPAIVHTHSSKAGIIGRWAAWLAGVPVILHSIHGFGFTPRQSTLARRLLVFAERLTARTTTGFIAVSEANRQLGIALGLFPPERCTVIRSGIDLAALRALQVDVSAKRRGLGIEPEGRLIGMVAPFKPQKAPLDFIRLAAVVHRVRPEARFLLVGDGDLRPAVEAEVQRHGLSNVVRLLGWRRDVAEIMACLDVFVLTSQWEGLPRVYLEALALGRPVVGTDVDGASEVITEGLNGHLVQAGDVAGLAEKVLRLLAEPARARRMGEAGRNLPTDFDIHEMVRRQEGEYARWLSLAAERNGLSVAPGYGTSAR